MPPETAGRQLRKAAAQLQQAGCETPMLDARLLLLHVTGLAVTQLVADPEWPVDDDAAARLAEMIKRRAAGEPVSRIIGQREFFGRSFEVTHDVLDPRADTETLVEAALDVARDRPVARVLDVGTGSGAIIVTLLAEVPDATGVATDFSAAALAVAARNAQMHGVAGRLQLVETSWANAVEGPFDLVVSNPPYIPAGDIAGLPVDVRAHDPHLALDGGLDGLDAYRALFPDAARLLAPGGHVLVEFGAGQHDDVVHIAAAAGLELRGGSCGLKSDLAGHVRCAVLRRL